MIAIPRQIPIDRESFTYINDSGPLRFYYKNHRGDVRERRVLMPRFNYGILKHYYPDKPQWFIYAFDVDKNAWRSFAMMNILGFIKDEPS